MTKKILHLLSTSKLSGAERVALDISTYLKGDFIFAYCSPKGEIAEVVQQEGFQFLGLNKMSISEVRKAVRKWNPNLIHAHDYRASILAVLAAPFIPVISHLHHNNPEVRGLSPRTLVYTALSSFFKKIVVISKPILSEFYFNNLIRKKTVILPNIINKERVLELSDQEGISSDLIFVGRLSPEKNPLGFIDLVYKLKQKLHDNIHTVIVGDGILKSKCEQRITHLGLSSNIRMTGFLANPYPYIKNSKVLVVPSLWEGFGLVVLEANLLGIPVVASRVGGLQEIVQAGKTGYLCDTEDEFLDKTVNLLKNRQLRVKLGEEAKGFAFKFSSVENYSNQLKEVYNSILA